MTYIWKVVGIGGGSDQGALGGNVLGYKRGRSPIVDMDEARSNDSTHVWRCFRPPNSELSSASGGSHGRVFAVENVWSRKGREGGEYRGVGGLVSPIQAGEARGGRVRVFQAGESGAGRVTAANEHKARTSKGESDTAENPSSKRSILLLTWSLSDHPTLRLVIPNYLHQLRWPVPRHTPLCPRPPQPPPLR